MEEEERQRRRGRERMKVDLVGLLVEWGKDVGTVERGRMWRRWPSGAACGSVWDFMQRESVSRISDSVCRIRLVV